MTDWIGPLASFLAVIIAAAIALKGTKTTNQTDALARAAGLYSDYADKMEERVAKLEENQQESSKRIEASEKRAELYKKETHAYRDLILEVIQWITELLDWEARDRMSPAPHFTLAMVLARLTNFMKSRGLDEFETESDDDSG